MYIYKYLYIYAHICSYICSCKLRKIRCLYLIFGIWSDLEKTNIFLYLYLRIQHGSLFGVNSHNFFLNLPENLIRTIARGKINHLFGSKEDIVPDT